MEIWSTVGLQCITDDNLIIYMDGVYKLVAVTTMGESFVQLTKLIDL